MNHFTFPNLGTFRFVVNKLWLSFNLFDGFIVWGGTSAGNLNRVIFLQKRDVRIMS